MLILHLLCAGLFIALAYGQNVAQEETCLTKDTTGCSLARPPQYMIVAPRRIRPNQVFQVFCTILRMESGHNSVEVYISITRGEKQYADSVVRFNRPSSRIMQLKMPSNAQAGKYKFRVEGRANEDSGAIWRNETEIEFTTKQASLFLQMSKALFRQGEMVHFRIIPIHPNMMPKYGSMIIFVDDPTGIPVRRWQGLQTNAGGIISQSFQLSDQPNYGTWNIRVLAFGHVYRHPFLVEEFWTPRFDVNVSLPAYIMDSSTAEIKGSVLANLTSGRPCKGNASLTVFFRPREEVWNSSKLWEKPYWDLQKTGIGMAGIEIPPYKPVSDVPIVDYHKYFPYIYKFVDFFEGRINFKWHMDVIRRLAGVLGEKGSLKGSEVVVLANVTDWYSSLNRTGWAGTILYDSQIKLEWVGENIRTFKPQSVMKIHVAVSKYDGTPVGSGGTVTVTDVLTSRGGAKETPSGPQTRTPVNGIAEFEFTTGLNTQTVFLKATYIDSSNRPRYVNPNFASGSAGSISLYATRYYSPTNSYITVMTSTVHPMVNEYMIFHVKTNYYVPRIYYQIVAQSNIIIGDELEMVSKQKTFAIALSREMVPTARIIVHYIRQPEEVVCDVLNFFVNGTRQNQVHLAINQGKDFSRDTVEFNAYADPGSYVAFSGILLDLYSRGMSDGITENKLIDELMTYDATKDGSFRQLWRVSDTDFEYKFFNSPDYGVDTNTSFNSAGLLVLTDARVPRLFNEHFCRINQKGHPCFSGLETECYSDSQRCDGKIDCPQDGADEYGCEVEVKQDMYSHAMDRMSRVMRFFDNSTWAWHEIFVKPDGRVDFRVDVPKYPLSWMINGLSISRNIGLGIMQRPIRYDTARFMYIQVEHPTLIVRGEQIGVRVTIFNYWFADDFLEVLVTMHGSKDSEFVYVGDMGIVSSYAPVTHKGDHQTIVFLEPGESKDIYMPIVPDKNLVRGTMSFKVSATCYMERDEYEGTMSVIPNGVTNYYHTPYLIDLIRFGSIQIPEFDVVVPQQFRVQEVRANQYVPQSPEAFVSLFGDVVTPGFFVDYLNAENILRRPYGGGEMITFNFAYNLLTLRFMKASQQLHNDQLERSLKEMNVVLQRILGYMNHTDGSFKMFRDDTRPSLWLTAFVAKTLHEANFGEWERELYIPRELINKMVLYICSRQNKSGAFVPADDDISFDRKLTSAEDLKGHRLKADPVPLTAYVLIALHETKDVSEDAAACVVTAKQEAAAFLADAAPNIKESLVMAITTYALSLTQKTPPFKELWDMRRNDSDFVYFADSIVYENPSKTLSTIRYNEPRQELMNDAYAVQSTAYALMAHINSPKGLKYEREMMMTWLNSMRNTFGGFASTQDTIVAMEALFKFTQIDLHRNVFDMTTSIGLSASSSWKENYVLRKLDYVKLYKGYMPYDNVFGYVKCAAQGTGRAMLQLTATMNVEEPELLRKPERVDNDPNNEPYKFFDIVVHNLTFSGRNQSIMEMTNCVSWAFTQKSLTSGLAVLEVDTPTGYVVMNDTLRDYVRSRLVPNLRRAEFYDRKVVFYFDYLDESRTCVYFRADRWYPVANATIQHRLRLYDYYEPGMYNLSMYTTKNLFTLNICFVCGSYQCPYCPFFNAGVILQASFSCCLFFVSVFIVQRLLLRPR